jgi:hypothetical protein
MRLIMQTRTMLTAGEPATSIRSQRVNDFEPLCSRKVRTHPIDIRSAGAVGELMDAAFAGGALDC